MEKLAWWTKELELNTLGKLLEHEEEFVEEQLMGNCSLHVEPSKGFAGDFTTSSESEEMIEEKIKVAIEVPMKSAVTKNVGATIEHAYAFGYNRQKEKI